MARDEIYREAEPQLVDFVFNEKVAKVFPDMIRRSVPGYDNIISMLGIFAEEYTIPKSRVYDLGSSLGASTLAAHQYVADRQLAYHCVDNSQAMIEQCRSNLLEHIPAAQLHLLQADVEDVCIENASLVMLNFTLQFIAPERRQRLINNAFQGLLPGGCLVLSEKIAFPQAGLSRQIERWHHAFKRANAYTELEISQKRAAIENILIPDTAESHLERLACAGFAAPQQWFQNLNFASFVALKAA